VEPTAENLRAFEELHRARLAAHSDAPGIPAPVRELLPDLEGRHVLDLMCGAGETSLELSSRGALVTAVDSWEPALEAARELAAGVAFLQADPHELPLHLRRRRFDLVHCGRALGLVHDVGALAENATAALKDGGVLLLYDAHPVADCVDPTTLRWRADYFGGTREVRDRPGETRTVPLWQLGDVVSAVSRAGLAVDLLRELRSLDGARRHDPRVPGAFVLVAEKPRAR
jgi:SAM-dependent methyltransferase